MHLGLEAIKNKFIDKENFQDSVFISFASDGMDNSDSAGAIVDKNTIEKAEKLGLDASDYSARFDSYNFFQKTGDLIFTGLHRRKRFGLDDFIDKEVIFYSFPTTSEIFL